MIVVTGGAGFIGSNVLSSLDKSSNTELVVSDWVTADKQANMDNDRVKAIVSPDHLLEFLDDNAKDIELVIHMGANSSTTDPDVDRVFHYNLEFTTRLWHWCAARNVRLIYASSASTYGDGSDGFSDAEDHAFLTTLRPLNAYAISKHAFDMRVARWLTEGAPRPPQWAGLKFFNVYGPNEHHKGDMASVVAKMVPQVERGETVRLFRSHRDGYRDGEQMRDFVYVKDCCAVIDWLVRNSSVNGLFNVGSGKARSFLDLVHAMFAALKIDGTIQFIDMPLHLRDRYQYFTEGPITKLRRAGYALPSTSLEDGVADYVRDHIARKAAP